MDINLNNIDNRCLKVIQNGNSKKRISTGKDCVIRVLPPVSAAEIHAVEKERKARTILLMAIPKEHLRRFHGMDDAKENLEVIRNRIAMIAIRMKKFYKKTGRRVWIDGNKPIGFDKKKLGNMMVLSIGENIIEEVDTNHALMATQIMRRNLVDKLCTIEFAKTDNFKGVPHLLTGDYTPKQQQEIDESLYVYGKKGPQKHKTSVSDDKFNEYSTCQSNDSLILNTGRQNVIPVRQNVNSVKSNVNTVRPKQPVPTSNSNSFSPIRPQVNKFNQSSNFSKSNSPVRGHIVRKTVKIPYSHTIKGNWGTAVKTSAGYNWRNNRPNFNCNSGSNFVRTVNAKGSSTQEQGGQKISWYSSCYKMKLCFLQNFIRQIENQLNHKVKIIRSDNGTKFKNRDMLEFCGNKGIKQEYSNARTPQQNGVAERMNRTLIEAARTMLADSLLPTTFWAEAVSTACYIFNRVEVNLHVKFLEEKPNVKGVGYRWMFDIDYLTDSMNYIPVSLENQTNPHAGTSEVTNSAGTLQTPYANASEEEDEAEELIVVPTVAKHTAAKVGPRKSSTNSKAEEFLTELQNLKTQEKEAYPTGISEDTPEILAFRRELDELAQKHLREEPKKISEALKDDSWVEAMQEELLQFRLQHVWILVDLPHGAKVIGTKWVYRNKRDERGVVVRNKARLVAQGHRQEEGIDYDEVFAPVARI
ncbi:retrovirus-related pol polyprotein from transposon TNT 1-94, partial [Tanacetum coccineum]